VVVASVTVEEHPQWKHLFDTWRAENKRATEASRKRNRARVFGLDVKALWRAHRPPKLPDARLFSVAKSLQRRLDLEAIASGEHQVQSVSPARAFEQVRWRGARGE
jgi:hypothetical protein